MASDIKYNVKGSISTNTKRGVIGPSGTYDHTKLNNRDAADQHPVQAITGLVDYLNNFSDRIQEIIQGLTDSDFQGQINRLNAQILSLIDYLPLTVSSSNKLVDQNQLNTRINEINETINQLNDDLSQDISQLDARLTELSNNIEDEAEARKEADTELHERIDSISIEELSKRTTYRTFLPENPSRNDRFVLVSEYTEGLNYYKHLEPGNTNYKMKFVPATVTAETFEPNIYYYYDENFNQEFVKTDVVKSSGYYPAYEFNPEDTYYEQVYDADDTNLSGMWELPLAPNYIGDWPDWAFGFINDTPGYFYREDGIRDDFERTGALRHAYGGNPNNECWGFAVGYSWNGQYGIIEQGRYIYPDKAGAGMGRGWAFGLNNWNQPDAKRILYYTENNPAFADGFKATGAVKVSDALLPFGDYNYKTKYVQVEVDRDTFEPGKYYTYFNKETSKQNEVNFIINTKNYVENIPYYEVAYIDKVSNEPVYRKITLTSQEFYAGLQNHDYYRLVTLTAQPEEYTVTRIQLDSDKSIYRDVLGNNLVEITDDNVIVGGENLIPNLTINRDKVTTVTLENNAETVFEKPIENLIIEIPDNLKHGFCSFISFETAKTDVSVSFNTVYANKPLKFIFSGATIAEEDLDFATETQYNLMFLCNGIYLEVYIQEIQLI